MCGGETKTHNPNEKTGVIYKLHEISCANLEIHQSLANGKGPHQIDPTKTTTLRTYQAKVGSKRLLHGNFLKPVR